MLPKNICRSHDQFTQSVFMMADTLQIRRWLHTLRFNINIWHLVEAFTEVSEEVISRVLYIHAGT